MGTANSDIEIEEIRLLLINIRLISKSYIGVFTVVPKTFSISRVGNISISI